jgi:hypothetical protein
VIQNKESENKNHLKICCDQIYILATFFFMFFSPKTNARMY